MRQTLTFEQAPPIPSFLIQDVLAKLAYLDERVTGATIASDGSSVTLLLTDASGADLRATLGERLSSVVQAMAEGAFEPEFRVLEEHVFDMVGSADPTPELVARFELVEEGPGIFALGPLLTRLIEYFEQRLMQVANRMGAAPYRFPALISPAYMEQVQYFRNFPHSLSFATHLRENLPAIQKFSCDAVTKEGRIEVDPEVYAAMPAMLAPTVCHHLYMSLRDRRLGSGGVVATASGSCFRFESRNMVSLERLWNFTMREVIFVGTDEQVRAGLDEVRGQIRAILADFNLSHKLMTANDPFFIGTFRDQAAYQAAYELKYEIRAWLPYKNDTLAIGSYNRHGDFFGRRLNIRLEDGSPAHTGCIGIGFERLAHTFVSQHGLDPAQWPRTVREAVGSLPQDR